MGFGSIQKIIFGPPGVGKSYYVHNGIAKELGINNEENKFLTVFHPEYRYGDFVGKLLPYTDENGQIKYIFYRGIFLKALAKAYKNILDNPDNPENVLLVIDEINRGNCAAIFGDIFQLLDRDDDGWSSYAINISDLELKELIEGIGFKSTGDIYNNKRVYKYKNNEEIKLNSNGNFSNEKIEKIKLLLENNRIKLPLNLSIVATMNTSNDSIYYMDPAFKRRWDWEYMNINGVHPIFEKVLEKCFNKIDECKGKNEEDIKKLYKLCKNDSNNQDDNNCIEEIEKRYKDFINKSFNKWEELRENINNFLKEKHQYIRGLDDKLIGKCFLKEPITYGKIINKMLFYLWDTVFEGNNELTEELLKYLLKILKENQQNKDLDISTFEDFILEFVKIYCDQICNNKDNKTDDSVNNNQNNNSNDINNDDNGKAEE